jgi:hypothetical protein
LRIVVVVIIDRALGETTFIVEVQSDAKAPNVMPDVIPAEGEYLLHHSIGTRIVARIVSRVGNVTFDTLIALFPLKGSSATTRSLVRVYARFVTQKWHV